MKHIIYICIASFFLFSCTKDEVLTDETKYADFDNNLIYKSYEKFSDKILDAEIKKTQAIDLTPGYHTVTLQVDPKFVAKGINTQRLFTYYVPKNLQNNYDIVFDLHGNFNYDPNLTTMTVEPWMTQFYDNKNAILIIPLGSVIENATTSNVYGWFVENGDLNFMDLMIRYFDVKIKNANGFKMNPSGIFSTGQSSGAIFSWALTNYRSEVFSAVVPRFGSVRLLAEMTLGAKEKYKVPMRVILGGIDPIVDYNAAMKNADDWAKYFMGIKTQPGADQTMKYCLSYDKKNPAKSTYGTGSCRTWRDGNTFMQTYSLPKMGHGHVGLIVDYDSFVYQFFINNRKPI